MYWIEWPGVGTFAFSTGSTEVRVWPDLAVSHTAIVNTFSRVVQPIILQAVGQQALHAGAVVGPAGVVVFCGARGSGKSTLAFAMQQVGWRQFADDAVVLRVNGCGVRACPLPFTPRLRPDSRAHLVDARATIALAEPQLTDLPLSAVFLLRQDRGLNRPRVSLVRGAEAFSGLVPHAHFFDTEDPTHVRQLLEDYLELVARVPVFTLEYEPNFQRLPQLTRAVMEAAISIDTEVVDFTEQMAIAS
jgi:hypothetical protein